jgi:anti-sigma B factor antagonist
MLFLDKQAIVQTREGLKFMENMTVLIANHPVKKNITLLSVKGFLDSRTTPDFEKELLWLLKEKKFKLIIDLKEVQYIASTGWGVFVSQIKRIRNQKGDLILSGMNPAVKEVFELLEFNRIMKSFPNVDSAANNGF